MEWLTNRVHLPFGDEDGNGGRPRPGPRGGPCRLNTSTPAPRTASPRGRRRERPLRRRGRAHRGLAARGGGHGHGPHRAQRGGQDDAVQRHHGAAAARPRLGAPGRHRRHPQAHPPPGSPRPGPHVPAPRALLDPQRRPTTYASASRPAGEPPPRPPSACSSGWASGKRRRARCRPCRPGRPASSSWPAPCRPIPRCCSSTSRARGSTSDETEALGRLLTSLAAEGRAVVMVEHDTDLVLRVCGTVHVLDFGQVIATGTPDEIRTQPGGAGGLPRPRRRGPGQATRSAERRTAAGPMTRRHRTGGLTIESVHAAYGRIEVLHGVDLEVPGGSRLRAARAQRGRQEHAAQGGRRPPPPDAPARSQSTACRHARWTPEALARAGVDRHPRGARRVPQPDRAGQPAHVDLPRRHHHCRGRVPCL